MEGQNPAEDSHVSQVMVGVAVRHFASVGTVGLVGLLAMTSAGCFESPEPPPKPVSNWTVEGARGFNEFPLYWLGESYQGLTLTSIRLSTDGDGVRHAEFNYGEPNLADGSPSQSWISPLAVDIQPYCGFSPEEFRSYEGVYLAEPVSIQIRGASGYAKRYSDSEASLDLWTGGSAIDISTWKSKLDIEVAAADLIPITGDTAATLHPLPPPITTSC